MVLCAVFKVLKLKNKIFLSELQQLIRHRTLHFILTSRSSNIRLFTIQIRQVRQHIPISDVMRAHRSYRILGVRGASSPQE